MSSTFFIPSVNMMGIGSLDEATDAIRTLSGDIGTPGGLGELNVKADDIPTLAANAMKDACGFTNPRPADQQQIEEIFRTAM
jgi:alcohol dehydrogenase